MNTRGDPDRRQFLTLTGVGAAGLAGCSGLRSERPSESDPEPEPPEPTPDGGSEATTRTVAMIVQPDPGELREAQLEVRSALDDGDIDRQEAERRLAEREQELVAAAIDTADDRTAATGVELLDAVEREGTLLVEGDPTALVDLLEEPAISAIVQRDRFEQARDRASAGTDPGADGVDDT